MYTGLGFEHTGNTEPDVPAAVADVVSSWDWHEWVMAGIAAFVVIRSIGDAFGSAAGGIKRRVKKSRARKDRIRRAQRDLEDAEAS